VGVEGRNGALLLKMRRRRGIGIKKANSPFSTKRKKNPREGGKNISGAPGKEDVGMKERGSDLLCVN